MTRPASRRQAPEPRIWSSVIRGLQLPLVEHNIDPDRLISQCGILTEDLQKPHSEIPLKKYLMFLETAARIAGDPLLGARLARSAGPETLGAIGFLFLSSRTLGEATNNLCHYMNVLQGATHVQLRQTASEITYTYQLIGVSDVDCRQDVEFSLALTCRLIRIFAGADIALNGVSFRHAASAPKMEYERLFKSPVWFDQDTNGVSFPVAFARRQSKLLDHGLARILQDYLDDELERRNRLQTFADQVGRSLLDGSLQAPVTAGKVARHLGVSEATLYRRLKVEGETFGSIVDARNLQLAKTYLSQSGLTVTQIAHLIGFSEPASFTRAFARWTGGMTPSEYRRLVAMRARDACLSGGVDAAPARRKPATGRKLQEGRQ